MLAVVEYLGFNNRTCTTSLSAGATAGPVMRRQSKSIMWREWMVRVVEEQGTGTNNSTSKKLVSLQAFIDPDVEDEARCLGYVSSFYDNPEYKWTCSVPPYGDGLFLNGTAYNTSGDAINGNSQLWSVQPAEKQGEFVLIAANKPDVCARALAANDCDALTTLVEYPVTGSALMNIYTSWKLIKRYDVNPTDPSPVPVPSPTPVPSPVVPTPLPVNPAFIPGPTIAAPSYTSSGSVNVLVKDIGGNNRCSVRSITIRYSGNNVGSVARTETVDASKPGLATKGVQLDLQANGYNSIYAFGKCSDGERTEISNQLSVLNAVPGGPTLIAAGAPSNVQESALSNTTATISWDDGLIGNPTELYTVKCVKPSGGSSSCTQSGENVTGIARGTQIGTVTGLTPNTEYHCYIIASNGVDDVCSIVYASVKTWIEAEQPYCVVEDAVSNTTTTIEWQDGAEGNPTETYTVNCVAGSSGTCLDPSGITTGAVNITRGTQTGTVEGLSPNTTYDCFVQAINPVATVCGDSPTQVTTWIEPGAPSNVGTASVQTQVVNVTWDDGAKGNPQETYTVNCVEGSGSTSCADAGVNVTGIARGVGIAEVTDLTSNTTYSCWAIATNTAASVCSIKPTVFTTPPICAANWTTRTSAADNSWLSVTWGGPSGSELFVAVATTGTGNRVMTSPDGITWTIQTSAADNNWESVTWGGPSGSELFVAVSTSGTGNRVMTSGCS
jgi:hypothetical protein